MSRVLGIDLGTTNSAMAVVNEYGRPEIVTNREGGRITPSVVMFDEETPVVGSIALNLAIARPLDVVEFVKRQMGDPEWRFRTASGDAYSPEQVSAMILKRLKEDAEQLLGERIEKAVISVPAYFDDARRKATQDAGRIAGLDVIHVFNEPTAAALAHGVDSSDSGTVLVYDLGGGTFDVTIMRLGGHEFTVVGTGGDANLGGFDWDNEVINWLNEQFMKSGGPNLLEDPVQQQTLRDHARTAKHTLTSREQATIFLSAHGFNERVILSRKQFDELTGHLLDRTRRIVEQVLEDAGLSWPQIDKVLLAGGSTRMPQVIDLLREMCGTTPSLELNPDEVVALGAAIQGALLAPSRNAPVVTTKTGTPIPLVRVQDVTSHSIGVVVMNSPGVETNAIIVDRGMQLPARSSTVLATLIDYQTQYLCQVTEGEDEDLRYVRIIGEGMIPLAGVYPAGAPMELCCEYDTSGIIHIYVRDLTTNNWLGELHLRREANLDDREIDAMHDLLERTVVE